MPNYSDWAIVRQNWAVDPECTSSTYLSRAGGNTAAVTYVTDTADKTSGANSQRQDVTAAGQSGALASVGNIPSGAAVKWSMKVKSSRAGNLNMYAEGNKDGAYAGFAASGGGTSTSIVADTWVTLYGQGTAPVGALTQWRFGFYGLNLQVGDKLWFDEITIEVNTPSLGSFFTGVTVPTDANLQRYRFLGTAHASASVYETRRVLVARATDMVTLTTLPAPTYVRTYYLSQDSSLSTPSVPTTNPPPSPWSTTEPVYQLGEDKTVYTVMVTAYGSTYFEYGPVQLSTAYKAAKDAYLAANSALVVANGKNRIVWSPSVPPASMTGFVEGDIWFQRNAANRITGQWEAIKTNGTLSWTARTLSNEVIASINAGTIDVGTLSTDRLGANTIGTNKLLISSFVNLCLDPSFEYSAGNNFSGGSTEAWSLFAGRSFITQSAAARTGNKHLAIKAAGAAYVAAANPVFEVKPGDQYRVGYWVAMSASGFAVGGTGIAARFKYGATESTVTTNGNLITSTPSDLLTDYVFIEGEWKVPDDARYARLELVQTDTATDARQYNVDDLEIFKMIQGQLIVDGTIKGVLIAADEITSLHIQALAIGAQHIQANSVYSDMIGANQIVGKHIAFQTIEGDMIKTGTLEVSHVSPTFGKDLIISGNVSIISAVAAANAAQSSANAVAGNVAAMQTFYNFGPTGAVISNPASVLATAIRSDRIEMLENGNVISYWNSGTLYVNQLQASRVTLASHQLEAFGTDQTVVRSLG